MTGNSLPGSYLSFVDPARMRAKNQAVAPSSLVAMKGREDMTYVSKIRKNLNRMHSVRSVKGPVGGLDSWSPKG